VLLKVSGSLAAKADALAPMNVMKNTCVTAWTGSARSRHGRVIIQSACGDDHARLMRLLSTRIHWRDIHLSSTTSVSAGGAAPAVPQIWLLRC